MSDLYGNAIPPTTIDTRLVLVQNNIYSFADSNPTLNRLSPIVDFSLATETAEVWDFQTGVLQVRFDSSRFLCLACLKESQLPFQSLRSQE